MTYSKLLIVVLGSALFLMYNVAATCTKDPLQAKMKCEETLCTTGFECEHKYCD